MSRASSAAPRRSIEEHVERWLRSPRTKRCITRVERIPPRPADYAPFPESVPGWLREALARRGAEQLYSHQAEAIDALDRGENVVVVTPTASGKTLCYNVPVLDMLRSDPGGTALYFFPTKALAQDQCAEINELLDTAGLDERAAVYDGDTPSDKRRFIRDAARVVLTNPDMLHQSILPNHHLWKRVLSSLRYVVVDEMHTYRGVFGSHVGNVIRRLQRLTRHYGATPQFVLASATIANPQELAESLVEQPVTVVDKTGAPSGEKIFVLYNPPILDAEQQRRQSAGSAAHYLSRNLLRDGHAVIVFTRSRQGVELLTRRLRETFREENRTGVAERIEGYRGGYLPSDRRRIERGLRAGDVLGVVSTNALELGIDIGSLDACAIAGYPGTIASTWQQAGRAGRRQDTALAVLIAGDDPVDQYVVNHPEYFFGASPEHGRIDPDNLRILAEHLKCAAFEMPVREDEGFGALPTEDVQEILAYLADEARLLTLVDGRWRWSTDGYPAAAVNIRDIYDENFVIIETTYDERKVLGEIDFDSAHKTIYEGAIYQHAARQYQVERLDYPHRKAYVRAVDVDYFTQAVDQTRVFVLEEFERAGAPVPAGCGEVRIVTRFVGYKKLKSKTLENIGFGEIKLPDLERHTTSYWVQFPDALLDTVCKTPDEVHGGLLGIAQAMHTVAVVRLMCASSDLEQTLGGELGETDDPDEPQPVDGSPRGERTLYLYDTYPGGVGFSEKLFELHDVILCDALDLIRACECPSGCPRCVGPATLVTNAGKRVAEALLARACSEGG